MLHVNRKNFKLDDAIQRAFLEKGERERLARALEELVLTPGEESSKAARKALRRIFDLYGAER
ncbi:hypothetical protein M8009_10385 [Halomonas sp. ATCH28]|uniref:Uncharacterized protein n=1 Tax=Halomonas gemina TaxID=2945105 RepID=A0ABT0T1J5_9GAMM|nr:hypothetical protein [Halomonas gemina]MCL7940697.1 hypothetical protein [Halomonas gemina]